MRKEITHMGSHNNLIGEDASIDLENKLSNELHVSNNNPPVFIAVSKNDSVVNPLNSILLSNAIKQVGRPVTLHVYPEGGHGWGYIRSFPYRKQMNTDMINWLDSLNDFLF
jgi:dipeptidyl aminopeptidase/acylaminoacyl peptidase